MSEIDYQDNQLMMEQVALSAIAQQHGTPTYVYSRAALESHYLAYRDALDGDKTVHFDADDGPATVTARWLVDAASRTSPLKRRLFLARRNGHDVNASWFRVAGEVRVDDWSEDGSWQERTAGRR